MLQASSSYKTDQERLDNLWQSCADAMYSITEREKQLGMKNMVCVRVCVCGVCVSVCACLCLCVSVCCVSVCCVSVCVHIATTVAMEHLQQCYISTCRGLQLTIQPTALQRMLSLSKT